MNMNISKVNVPAVAEKKVAKVAEQVAQPVAKKAEKVAAKVTKPEAKPVTVETLKAYTLTKPSVKGLKK